MTPSNVTPLHPKPAGPADLARDAHDQAKGYTSEAENAGYADGEAWVADLRALAALPTMPPARRDRIERLADFNARELRDLSMMKARNP